MHKPIPFLADIVRLEAVKVYIYVCIHQSSHINTSATSTAYYHDTFTCAKLKQILGAIVRPVMSLVHVQLVR